MTESEGDRVLKVHQDNQVCLDLRVNQDSLVYLEHQDHVAFPETWANQDIQDHQEKRVSMGSPVRKD